MAHAVEQKWPKTVVVSVDTGFAHPDWGHRVREAEAYARRCGLEVVRLRAEPDFANLVRAQGEFPTPKFQWCAVYLKGDSVRRWLDQSDPLKKATILLARRRSHSPKWADLPEYVYNDEAFAGRLIWHPLYLEEEEGILRKVATTGLAWLPHRSLECDPCVNSSIAELQRASPLVQARLYALEQDLGDAFLQKNTQDKAFIFDMGCGSPYGCGL